MSKNQSETSVIEKRPAPTFSAKMDRAAMLRAVQAAFKSADNRGRTIPILGYLAIEAVSPETVRITGTDLDHSLSIEIDAEGAEGRTTLPGKTLEKMLKSMWGLDLTFSEADKGVRIASDTVTATLYSLHFDDFPFMLSDPTKKPTSFARVNFPETTFEWLLNGVRFAVSEEEARYYLNGICVELHENEILAVATDGHRLATRRLKAPSRYRLPKHAVKASVILPRTSLTQMLEASRKAQVKLEFLAPKKQADKSWHPTHVRLSVGRTTIVSKLIDGTFPDWRKVVTAALPAETPVGFLRINRGHLTRALTVAKTMLNERGRGLKFDVTAEGVTLSAEGIDVGTIVQPLDVENVGVPPMKIGFNVGYLESCIGALELVQTKNVRLHIRPGEEVKSGDIGWRGENPAVIVADEEPAPDQIILMPMRV